MNALLFFLGARSNYRSPLLSEREVFCGPDTEDEIVDGRVRSLRTPVGTFDLGAIVRRLPPEQQPDYVVVKADATRRLLPRGLSALKCPRVLLVGDTHHLHQPLQTLLRYASEEPFDFIILDHTRHHARWFHAAGFRNVHWLPALDFGFMPRARVTSPSRPLTFVGQAGKHHPYRRHVLERVAKAGLPLEVISAPLQKTADLYADSAITLNVSLNGDLNLRVFESLSAGGFLLTDELCASSGLPLLFESEKHLVTWRTADDLIEKIRWYQANPRAADRIREAGRAELVAKHHPQVKIGEFHDLVFSSRENPRYALSVEPERSSRAFHEHRQAWVAAYEAVQDLHASAEAVIVMTPAGEVAAAASCLDLPRVEVVACDNSVRSKAASAAGSPAGTLHRERVLWWPGTSPRLDEALSDFSGSVVFADEESESILTAWGYRRAGAMHYRLAKRAAWLRRFVARGGAVPSQSELGALLRQSTSADEALAIAEISEFQPDLLPLYGESLQRAVSLDRACGPALLRLGKFRMESGNLTQAAILMSEASRCTDLPEENAVVLRQFHESLANDAEFAEHRKWLAGCARSKSGRPRRILVVTNLFPPEELGGYGRMMWEFSHGLHQRGHEVRVLCGRADYLRKNPTAEEDCFEKNVSRCLDLLGEWRAGVTRLVGTETERQAFADQNSHAVVAAARAMRADLVLLGNLDFLGVQLLHAALADGFTVLHALANAGPGYEPELQPRSPNYLIAPCSDWNGRAFQSAGYRVAQMKTLYPGARLELFYRYVLPSVERLRIAYASLVMPYKGAHVLVEALAMLHNAGVDFSAEIAGDSTSPEFLAQLKEFCRRTGIDGKVSFVGFLDRSGLSALFARSNVLVFPSQFEEPFGISQVEAMAAGLVVISSGTGGAAEIVRNGVDGLLFPAKESKALAAHLVLLSRKPEMMRVLQTGARRRALDFSVETAVQEIELIIERAAGKGVTK